MKAAELILDRAPGKAPQHVSLDVKGPWEQLMAEAIVSTVQPDKLYRLRPSKMADEDEELMLCIRCRALRRFLIFWMWVFRLGEGVG